MSTLTIALVGHSQMQLLGNVVRSQDKNVPLLLVLLTGWPTGGRNKQKMWLKVGVFDE